MALQSARCFDAGASARTKDWSIFRVGLGHNEAVAGSQQGEFHERPRGLALLTLGDWREQGQQPRELLSRPTLASCGNSTATSIKATRALHQLHQHTFPLVLKKEGHVSSKAHDVEKVDSVEVVEVVSW